MLTFVLCQPSHWINPLTGICLDEGGRSFFDNFMKRLVVWIFCLVERVVMIWLVCFLVSSRNNWDYPGKMAYEVCIFQGCWTDKSIMRPQCNSYRTLGCLFVNSQGEVLAVFTAADCVFFLHTCIKNWSSFPFLCKLIHYSHLREGGKSLYSGLSFGNCCGGVKVRRFLYF